MSPPTQGMHAADQHLNDATRDEECVRHGVLYCTPHVRVPGVLAIHSSHLWFEPDPRHQEVRELGAEEYRVIVEVRDLIESTAVAMPGEEQNSIDFFLQLYVRTLDGRSFCSPEDAEHGWCVVFGMHSREDLHEAAQLTINYIDALASNRSSSDKAALRSSMRRTFVPFPCLDRASVYEAVSKKKEMKELATTGKIAEEKRPNERRQPAPSHVFGVTIRCDLKEPPLLTADVAECLFEYLPVSARLPGVSEWVLAYSPKAHGVSLATFYRNVEKCRRTLVLIADTQGFVFGGFAPEAWLLGRHFYGSGEAFVFTFGKMTATPQARLFPATTKNRCFMYSDSDSFAMGSSSTGKHAIAICSDMLHGFSAPSMTYGNPMLSATEEFIIQDLEVWSFEELHGS
mmetsp:Transcript_51105/g.121421  ORF Transcript_51105/g.121421 Transcript_51105/m.121421 type:complete len:400 (-) Transcript_51105:260-1459(-)